MVKLSSFYLSLVILYSLTACQSDFEHYKKEFSAEESKQLPQQFLNNIFKQYYQGAPAMTMLLREGLQHAPTHGDLWRDLAIPYLKRGMAAEFYTHFEKVNQYAAEDWQGYYAYNLLYIYRDYERALQNIEAYDAYTPDFVDYPQSTSVDYMRGICYYHLGEYTKAVHYLQKHLEKEIEEVGEKYVSDVAFLHLAIAHAATGDYDRAFARIEQSLQYVPKNADLWYYKARFLHDIDRQVEARQTLVKAQEYFTKGYVNHRPYVEEFFAIYQEDIDRLNHELTPP